MLETKLNCKYCAHCEECHGSDYIDNEGCEIFEQREDMWFEMSYYRYAPRSMQQRLRDGE